VFVAIYFIYWLTLTLNDGGQSINVDCLSHLSNKDYCSTAKSNGGD